MSHVNTQSARVLEKKLFVSRFADIASKKLIAGQRFSLLGYSVDDIGSGEFIGVAGASTNDYGIITPSGTAGINAVRTDYVQLDVAFYGVIGNGVADDYAAFLRIKNAYPTAYVEFIIDGMECVCATALTMPKNIKFILTNGAKIKSGALLVLSNVRAANANNTYVKPAETSLGGEIDQACFSFLKLTGNSTTGGNIVAHHHNLVDSEQVVLSNAGGAYCHYSEIRHGGASSSGGYVGAAGFSYMTSNGNTTAAQKDSVGIVGYAASLGYNYGGTPGVGNSKGSVFGSNFYARLDSGSTGFYNLTGGEVNTDAHLGSSVDYKSGLQIVGAGTDAVSGSIYDCGLAISAQIGAVGYQDGILIGHMNSYHPLKTTSTIIRTVGTSTVATGIDFSSYSFNTAVLKSSAVTLLDGALVLGNTATATRFIDFKTANATNYNARLLCQGGSATDASGDVSLLAQVVRLPAILPHADATSNLGSGALRMNTIYASTGTINTSDERSKQQVSEIDKRVFAAWSKVKFTQYKFNDAVEKKGDGARWHFGVIAQRVKEAFESVGLDAFEYGLLCYDSWGDEWEHFDAEYENVPATYDVIPAQVFDGIEVVAEQVITVTEASQKLIKEASKRLRYEAGDRYGIRYEEALCLETAFMRYRLDLLEQKLSA